MRLYPTAVVSDLPQKLDWESRNLLIAYKISKIMIVCSSVFLWDIPVIFDFFDPGLITVTVKIII
jgi:hypothetical protein